MKRFLGACVTHYRNLGGCDLPGCVHDGESALLRLRELYDFDKLVILNDGDADRESILQHLREAVRDSEDGDELVFLYSGHGTQVLDDSGREVDGLAECICPADIRADRDDELIRLREIHDVLTRLRPGGNATILMDCCHGEDACRDFRGAARQSRYLPRVIGAPRRGPATTNRDWPYVWLTACRCNETAADIGTGGAFSCAFWSEVDAAPAASMAEIAARTWTRLRRERFGQNPVLHGCAAGIARPVFGGPALA